MIVATDWTGIAAAITALFGGIAAVVGAYFAAHAKSNTDTPSGTPKLGEIGPNVAAAVTTPPNVAPLGQVLSEVATVADDIKEAVNGKPAT